MKGGGILPFMDPEVYGRSLMECSSFIASSAFPDPSIVGTGFLARLSGSTAEFMDMWKHMFIGPKLFYINDRNEVEMQLAPALPSWLFVDDDADDKPTLDEHGYYTIRFKLFGEIPVTYHNPSGGNLYGTLPTHYLIKFVDDHPVTIGGPSIPTEWALKIRRVKSVASIDAFFPHEGGDSKVTHSHSKHSHSDHKKKPH
jgi:hypothetical protein